MSTGSRVLWILAERPCNACAIGDVHNLKCGWHSFFWWYLCEWMRQEVNAVEFGLLLFVSVFDLHCVEEGVGNGVWVLGGSETCMRMVDQDQMNAPGFAEGSLYAAGCNRTPLFLVTIHYKLLKTPLHEFLQFWSRNNIKIHWRISIPLNRS
jgi:hypothetical protein